MSGYWKRDMEVITKSAAETKEFGRKFSADLAVGDVVALSGELGSGKTVLVQGIAEGLNIKNRVNSPTFIIMRSYNGTGSPCDSFYHVDLYRLDDNIAEEVENLGILNIIKEGKSIVVIEWAEKIENLLPTRTKWVRLKNIGEEERKIILR